MDEQKQDISKFARVIERADQLLRETIGASVAAGDSEVLSDADRRNALLRCRNLSGERPATFIIKQVVAANWNPEEKDSWDTERFFKDWAGARFLSELEIQPACSPKYYCGDRDLGFFVIEDLGTPRTLVEPLLNESAADAEAALVAYGSALGRLHAATAGKSGRYNDIYRELSGTPAEPGKRDRMADASEVVSRLAMLEIDAGEVALRDLEQVRAALDDPGPFHAFIHGDPCPDNIFLIDNNVVLIDFEFARFGHALLDGVYGRMMFPTCWCCNRLPRPIVDRMEAAYRAELAKGIPLALEDAAFHKELVNACAGWLLGALSWHLERMLVEDSEWGIASVRSRIISRLEVFAATSEEYGLLPGLRECAYRVHAELRRRWPETDRLSIYPAFRS